MADYSSIPQANYDMKMMCISSIAVYASVCRYFICLCPTVTLKSPLPGGPTTMDLDSYRKRGWVRTCPREASMLRTARPLARLVATLVDWCVG